MNQIWVLLLAFGVSVSAQAAAVYECTDASGRKVYTQSPGKNCRSSNLGKPSVYTGASVVAVNESASAGVEMPPSAAGGDVGEERQALVQAQKALAEGKAVRLGNERNYAKYLERVQGLEKQVKAAEQKLRAAEQGGVGSDGGMALESEVGLK